MAKAGFYFPFVFNRTKVVLQTCSSCIGQHEVGIYNIKKQQYKQLISDRGYLDAKRNWEDLIVLFPHSCLIGKEIPPMTSSLEN